MTASQNCSAVASPVDHVVVTAAQLSHQPVQDGGDGRRPGNDGREILGCVARRAAGADTVPADRWTLVSGFLSVRPRPNSADRQRRQRCPGIARGRLRLELARCASMPSRPASSTRSIRAAMPEAARRDMLAKTAASLPVGRVGMRRGHRAANSELHGERFCDRIDRLYRRRGAGDLTGRGGHHGFRKQRRLHPQHRRSAVARIPQSFRRRAVESRW